MTRHFASLSLGFAALAVASLALKANVPEASGAASPLRVAARLVDIARQQGFAVRFRRVADQSPIALGVRGNCRIAARDASDGPAIHDIFTQQTADIGPLHYIYRGVHYATLPGLRIFADLAERRTLDRFGIHLRRPVPVALAQSAGCPLDPLNLPDFSVGQ